MRESGADLPHFRTLCSPHLHVIERVGRVREQSISQRVVSQLPQRLSGTLANALAGGATVTLRKSGARSGYLAVSGAVDTYRAGHDALLSIPGFQLWGGRTARPVRCR